MTNQLEYYLLAKCAAQAAARRGFLETSAALHDVAKSILNEAPTLNEYASSTPIRNNLRNSEAFSRFLH